MERLIENLKPEKNPNKEEMWEIDKAIEEIVRVNEGILLAIRERYQESGRPKEEFSDAFASNFKFKVADFIKKTWKINNREEESIDEFIIKRLKERASEFI